MKNTTSNSQPSQSKSASVKEGENQVSDNQTPPQPGNVHPVENTGANLVDQKPKWDRGDPAQNPGVAGPAHNVAAGADYVHQEGGLPRKEEDKKPKGAVDLENPDPNTRKSSI